MPDSTRPDLDALLTEAAIGRVERYLTALTDLYGGKPDVAIHSVAVEPDDEPQDWILTSGDLRLIAAAALRTVRVPVTEEMVEAAATQIALAVGHGTTSEFGVLCQMDVARRALTAALSLPSPGTTTEEE